MQTFAQKQSQPRQPASSSLARPAASRSDHPTRPQLLLQLAMGNQRAQGTRHPDAEGPAAKSSGTASPPVEQESPEVAASGELEQPPVHIRAHPPARLPAATPAWTSGGEIHLGPAGLFMPPEQQTRMLRHEAFHSLHQRVAPVSDAPQARAGAERRATGAESGFGGGLRVPMTPAPALLAFPPQPHAPWNKVFLGYTHAIGEVEAGGVIARILLSYKDLGITRAPAGRNALAIARMLLTPVWAGIRLPGRRIEKKAVGARFGISARGTDSRIAAVRGAHRRHGGAGSLYIILRRPRSGSTLS